MLHRTTPPVSDTLRRPSQSTGLGATAVPQGLWPKPGHTASGTMANVTRSTHLSRAVKLNIQCKKRHKERWKQSVTSAPVPSLGGGCLPSNWTPLL